jgi:peptidyl-tRNA hydrolase
MENPILYVVLNGELKMSAGKAAAQAVHAAMMLEDNYSGSFAAAYKRTVIVLEAKNAEQIKNLEEYLTMADVFAEYYIDEGVNEVDAYSVTALAVEPIAHDDTEKREIFASFPLFGYKKNDDVRWWHK